MREEAGKTYKERWYNQVRSRSHALPRLAPLYLAWGPRLPHSLSLLPCLLPTIPAFIHPSIINHSSSYPSIHHSSVPPSSHPYQNSPVGPLSQRRSTGISNTSRSHLFSPRWNPPFLLHKETLTLLQCSIRRCCATALKIPQGQWGEKLKTGYRQSYSVGEKTKWIVSASLSVIWRWEYTIQSLLYVLCLCKAESNPTLWINIFQSCFLTCAHAGAFIQ